MGEIRVISLQVGMPVPRVEGTIRNDGEDQTWLSGIFKSAVDGPVWAGALNLNGDGQADLKHHGGPDRPILAYGAAHYAEWNRELAEERGRSFEYGSFGENLTIEGLDEASACLGDTYQIGEAVVQVSQPRIPCWKLGRRNQMADLPARVSQSGRTGWYMRVLQEGYIQAGQVLTLVDRPYPVWTIERAHAALKQRKHDPDLALELSQCPYLSRDWKDILAPKSV